MDQKAINQLNADDDQKPVNQLKVNDRFEGYLLVRSSEQRYSPKGGPYLDLNLKDSSGEINCKVWERTVAPPPQGSVVKVTGQVQDFNGRLQMRITKIAQADGNSEVDLSRLVPAAPEKPESMLSKIEQAIDTFESGTLKKIVREMLRLAGEKLQYYPAAMRMHHAERSGLLHHTTDMLAMADRVLICYPFLNAELLRAGVIIHDLGKIWEMKSDKYGNVSDYTRDGLLVGHLVRGVTLIDKAAANVDADGEWVTLLEHMMISHHGQPDYGSPVYPCIPEAIALHAIDNFDALMNEVKMIEDRTPEGAFSEKIPFLDGRRIYHPFYKDEAETERGKTHEPT